MPIKIYKTKHRNIHQCFTKPFNKIFLCFQTKHKKKTQKPNTKLKPNSGELCGTSVSLRCQLSSEDLDALVSITSDEDLANLIEKYDKAASSPSSMKIRAFLSPSKPPRKSISSPLPPLIPKSSTSSSKSSSSSSCSTSSPSHSPTGTALRFSGLAADVCLRQISPPVALFQRFAVKIKPHCAYHAHGNPSNIYLIHNGNHWQ